MPNDYQTLNNIVQYAPITLGVISLVIATYARVSYNIKYHKRAAENSSNSPKHTNPTHTISLE